MSTFLIRSATSQSSNALPIFQRFFKQGPIRIHSLNWNSRWDHGSHTLRGRELTNKAVRRNDNPRCLLQASLEVTCGQHVDFPVVVGFIDHNYRYKLVATRIPYDAGFAPVHPAGERIRDHCVQVSDFTSALRRPTRKGRKKKIQEFGQI